MKKITLIGSIIVALAAIAGIYSALQTGQKSPVYIAGDIVIPEAFRGDTAGVQTLFIIVFDQDSPMPMPFGAMKSKWSGNPAEPQSFFMTRESLQTMNPDARPPARLRVKVRLDRDGFGGPDQPGDLVGMMENVAIGTEGLKIEIQQKIP